MNFTHSLRRSEKYWGWSLSALMVLFLFACSKPNSEAPVFVNGKHASGWVNEHGAAFISNNLQCHQCHGEDLREGGLLKMTGPTCFSASNGTTICHGSLSGPWHNRNNNPIFFSQHGVLAQKVPGLSENGPQGFNFCAACHNLNAATKAFPGQRQGVVTPVAGCVGCHTFINKAAPHSGADPWDLKHGVTSPENAPSCGECHRNRQDFRVARWGFIPFAYDATAKPGCFNNTLCHGENVNPHADQVNWTTTAAPLHGLQAKQSPQRGSLYGFANCALCHGQQFADSCANNSACHLPPHPASWSALTFGVVTHVSTNADNAASCAGCHAGGALSPLPPPTPPPAPVVPGCYNNTLCHGSRTPHDSSWSEPTRHGSSAKLPPAPNPQNPYTIDQFVNCQICHGPYFDANKCGTCHLPPHPVDWMGPKLGRPDLGLLSPSHTNTDASNGNVCFYCHAAGSINNAVNPVVPAPIGTEPGCFNSTLCHGDENQFSPVNHNPPEVWSLPENHGASAKAAPSSTDSAQSLTRCIVCHSVDLRTGCTGFCHNPPHPQLWSGNGTLYTHQDTQSVNAPVCAVCHAGGRSPAIPVIPPPGSVSGCFDNSLCH